MATIDNARLRRLTRPELAVYLRELSSHISEADISAHLFGFTESESIPTTALCVWICIAESALLPALRQDFSFTLRTAAIHHLVKVIKSCRWKPWLDQIGGGTTLTDILSQLSLAHIRFFLNKTRSCARFSSSQEKRELLQEIYHSVLPFPIPKTAQQGSTPGYSWWKSILPICDFGCSEHIQDKLNEYTLNRPDMKAHSIIRLHYELLRGHCNHIDWNHYHLPKYLDSLKSGDIALPSTVSDLSPSLAFSFGFLRQLASNEDLKLGSNESVHDAFIQPLMDKAFGCREHIGWPTLYETLSLSVKVLDRYPPGPEHTSLDRGSFFRYVPIAWSLAPSQRSEFEVYLVLVLQKLFDKKDRQEEKSLWHRTEQLMPLVPFPLRYQLLRLIFIHCYKGGIDIDKDDELKRMNSLRWPAWVFRLLHDRKALDLLTRIRSLHGDDFLQSDHLIVLLGELGEHEGAMSDLQRRKSASERSRDQDQRASLAESALHCAVATGSLKFYSETLQWARRFIRDPLTSRTIFSSYVIDSNIGLSLLAAIPSCVDHINDLGVSDIEARVIEANQVIFQIFETVSLALREPSFQLRDWNKPLCILEQVIALRVKRIDMLQATLKLTDAETYTVVFEDTLGLALRIEEFYLQPGRDVLARRFHTGGPLNLRIDTSYSKKGWNLCLRFVNELAKARDTLWREHRLKISPAVVTLPQLLPRGLTIQGMGLAVAQSLMSHEAAGLTPYLFSRAEAVLFPEPSGALSLITDDGELQSAIGKFLDSYGFALRLYVKQRPRKMDADVRISQAWLYALKELSSSRMNQSEAYRFWWPIFKRELPEFGFPNIDEKDLSYPLLPSVIDPREQIEWNPEDVFQPPPVVKSRSLEPTYLDLSINSSSYASTLEKLSLPHPRTIEFTPPHFEAWRNLSPISKDLKANPNIREAIFVSALLYLDSKIKGPRSVLTTPFPSFKNLRYPSVYLADEFLQRDDLNIDQALEALQTCFPHPVPPSTLLQLATSALEAFLKEDSSSTNISEIESLTFRLLIRLSQSDMPQAASDLMLRAVVDRPDASSWHRQLISHSFLTRLPPKHAEQLIRSFADTVKEALHKKPTSSEASVPQDKRPFVKITTVKLLVQLLNNPGFVSKHLVLEILTGLLQSSSHIDIRVAIVNSLHSLLFTCTDKVDGNKILSTLETLIPIAGGIDERRQLSEEEWKEAERTRTPPEVALDPEPADTISAPTIMKLLFSGSVVTRLTEEWRKEYVERILLPIYEQSIAVNTRWLKIFAAKYELDLDSMDLPKLPVYPGILRVILRHGLQEAPASVLTLCHRFIIINRVPTKQLIEFVKILEEPRVRKLPEIRHFMWLYGDKFRSIGDWATAINGTDRMLFASMLLNWDLEKKYAGLELAPLQEYAFWQAKALILDTAELDFKAFMINLRYREPSRYHRPNDDSEIDRILNSLGQSRPVVERVIAYIDSLRTPEWQLNHNRWPATLPSSLQYKLWLLPYPPARKDDKDESNKDDIAAFAQAVYEHVEKICADSKPYHDGLHTVKMAFTTLLAYQKAEVGCSLGRLEQPLSLPRHLCVEMAEQLFEDASPSANASKAASEVILSWRHSEVEAIRRQGFDTVLEQKYLKLKQT